MLTRRNIVSSLILAALAPAVWLAGCSRASDPWGGTPQPHILVSVPPLYSFAKSVAGTHGDVKSICKENGPHGYKESTTDNVLLRGATRFFCVGLGLDDAFADAMVKATDYPKDQRLELGEMLPETSKRKLKDLAHDDHKDKDHDHKDHAAKDKDHKDKDAGHHHQHGDDDPHVWLGTPQAIAMVGMIRDELKKADPANAADYDKNATQYIAELKKLHDDGMALLKDKKHKKIISFHESLGYFANEFGITIVDVIEDFPATEPDPSKIHALVQKFVDDPELTVIAVEPQFPTSTAAATIKRELKAKNREVKLVPIDPLETAAEKDLSADLYIKTMRENLKNLADNLQ